MPTIGAAYFSMLNSQNVRAGVRGRPGLFWLVVFELQSLEPSTSLVELVSWGMMGSLAWSRAEGG